MDIGEFVREMKRKKKKKNEEEEEEEEEEEDDDGVIHIPMPEFRVVTKDMKDLTYDPLSSFRGPTDVMNLFGVRNNENDSGDGGGFEGNPSFQQFMEKCVRPSEM